MSTAGATVSANNAELNLFNDVTLAQNGDHQAFARIINQTRNLVSSIALSIVKDLDSSEDVAQQVYIGAWQQLNTLKNSQSFLPWLRQMTRYKALNFLRDNKTKQKVSGEEAELLLAQYCDPSVEAENDLHRQQVNLIVQEFINQIPEESREIVLLYYREDQSSQQVAKLLEQSETNIRKKLSRVRQLLHQKILQKHGRLLLTTAPTLGLSSLVLGAITTSSPVAAAISSSAAASGKSGLLQKLGILFCGSMIAAFFAVIAVRLSTRMLLKNITEQQARQQVLNYRQTMTWWLIFGGILLTISYEFTQGWWAPITAYSIFAYGVVFQIRKMHKLIELEVYAKPNQDQKALRSQKWQRFCGFWGNILGMLTGFVGLIIGLVNSGRLPF